MWPDLRKGVLYTHLIMLLCRGIASFVNKILSWNFVSNTYNDRKGYLPNFKAVGQIGAELHIFKVEKMDACITPLFANPVTYVDAVILVSWDSYVCDKTLCDEIILKLEL